MTSSRIFLVFNNFPKKLPLQIFLSRENPQGVKGVNSNSVHSQIVTLTINILILQSSMGPWKKENHLCHPPDTIYPDMFRNIHLVWNKPLGPVSGIGWFFLNKTFALIHQRQGCYRQRSQK